MIVPSQGDMLAADAEALVNAVNTVGVMGKGIALQFRRKFPEMFAAYETACRTRQVQPGRMHVFDRGTGVHPARWIINFPTKRHWRDASRMSDLDAGLTDLAATVQRLGIRTIAIPPLGCGLGGLDWSEVRPRIEASFASLAQVRVLLYAPVSPP